MRKGKQYSHLGSDVLILLAEHGSLIKSVSSFVRRHGVGIDLMLVSANNEPDGGRTLTRNHGAPGKEDFMEAVSFESISLDDTILVFDQVVVPHLDGVSVMHSLVPYGLDFESSTFDHVDVPVEGARSIGSREDVFTHENTPK